MKKAVTLSTRSEIAAKLLPASNIVLGVPLTGNGSKNKHYMSFGHGNKEERWT